MWLGIGSANFVVDLLVIVFKESEKRSSIADLLITKHSTAL